jgi:hypothetical protein
MPSIVTDKAGTLLAAGRAIVMRPRDERGSFRCTVAETLCGKGWRRLPVTPLADSATNTRARFG